MQVSYWYYRCNILAAVLELGDVRQMSISKWDCRFMAMAKLIASWSKDPSTKVGAVIVDDKHRVVSVGFNGLPHGVSDNSERLNDRETKLRMVIHAEENALLFANRSVSGCTAYVWPLLPCARCASKLIQAGIRRVVGPANGREHWREENEIAVGLMKEAGISVVAEEHQQSRRKNSLEEIQAHWAERWGQQDL